MKQDRRAARQDVPRDKLHPASDMNARAAGGDKESNEPLRGRQSSRGPQTTPGRKPAR